MYRIVWPRLFVAVITAFVTAVVAEVIFRTIAPQWSDQWKMWRSDPIHGIGLQRNVRDASVHGVSKEFAFNFSTNSQGLRMDYDLSNQKPSGTKRVLIVGDSFTFGYGVQQNQSFPSELQNLLDPTRRQVEVINAGFASGFTVDTEYLFTREVGTRWHPDLVLVGVTLANDLDDLETTRWKSANGQLTFVSKVNEYVPLWVKKSGLVNLFVKWVWPRMTRPVNGRKAVRGEQKQSSACSLPEHPYRAGIPESHFSLPPTQLNDLSGGWSEAKRADWVIKAWAYDARVKGYGLKLLFIPDREEVQGTFSDEGIRRMLFIRSVFSSAAKSTSLEILDPTLEMRRHWCKTGVPFYFAVDGHWNSHGHHFIASWLVNRISAMLSE